MRIVNKENKLSQYLIIIVLLLGVAIIIAYTASSIFSAMRVANEIDETLLQNSAPRVNQEQLDRVFNNLNAKSAPPLD